MSYPFRIYFSWVVGSISLWFPAELGPAALCRGQAPEGCGRAGGWEESHITDSCQGGPSSRSRQQKHGIPSVLSTHLWQSLLSFLHLQPLCTRDRSGCCVGSGRVSATQTDVGAHGCLPLVLLAEVKTPKRRQPFVPFALRNLTGCTVWFATLTTTPTR